MPKIKGKHTKDSIKKILEETLETLIGKDNFLISENSNERSITHKFASILEPEFSEYNVDCEYNRMTNEEGKQVTKRIYGDYNEETPVNDLNAKTVYPDIIVHCREDSEHNLLIIEAKKNVVEGYGRDYEKLNFYMEEKKNGGLGYDFSAFIVFDTENPKNSKVDVKKSGEIWK